MDELRNLSWFAGASLSTDDCDKEVINVFHNFTLMHNYRKLAFLIQFLWLSRLDLAAILPHSKVYLVDEAEPLIVSQHLVLEFVIGIVLSIFMVLDCLLC